MPAGVWIARWLLPASLLAADVVVHEVVADAAVGYARREQVVAGGVEQARAVGLWLQWRGAQLTTERLPGRAAYPRPGPSTRLYTVDPGQVGRVSGELPLHRMPM